MASSVEPGPVQQSAPRDARAWQIAALSSLLVLNLFTLDYGASAAASAVAIAGALSTQWALQRVRRQRVDLRSALITGLSLSLLLRGDGLWVMAVGAVLAISSKFLFRVQGRHLWNPATFGIVIMLLSGHAWVSPGQWGASVELAAFLAFLATAVLGRAGQGLTALGFLAAEAALLAGRAVHLGDPLAIPVHQMASGSLLLFAFFMVTDPKTTPRNPACRVAYVCAVALLAFDLSYVHQLRPALYWALFAFAPLVPLLNHLTRATAARSSRVLLPGTSP